MVVDEEKNSVLFYDEQGEGSLSYADLNVFDANGQRVPAHFKGRGSKAFSIEVDDSKAAYPILVDPLAVSLSRSESQSTAQFGFSVAAIDAYAICIAVGAHYFDTGSYTDAGKVFLYFSTTGTMPANPSWTKEGDQANGRFGWSVADARDVNGDGHNDLLVGAPYYDSGGYTDNGKAYLFFSDDDSDYLEANASVTITHSQSSEHLGYAVMGLGDNNVDGYGEIAIGVPDYNYVGTDEGMILIYKGTNATTVTYSQTFIGSSASRLGFSLAYAADIDGNSYPDFIAGMPDYNSSGAKGGAKVFFGSGSGTWSSTTLVGETAGDKFGWSVAGIGKVDGGSYPAVLVGAPKYSNGQTDEGKVYIYRGQSGGINTTAWWTHESNYANSQHGYSVAGNPEFGDLNSDDNYDFAVGSPYYDSPSTDAGVVYFYLGDPSAPVLDGTSTGTHTSELHGFSIAIGKIDAFRHGLVVGAPGYSGGSIGTLYYDP